MRDVISYSSGEVVLQFRDNSRSNDHICISDLRLLIDAALEKGATPDSRVTVHALSSGWTNINNAAVHIAGRVVVDKT